jgi:hypothetical protein
VLLHLLDILTAILGVICLVAFLGWYWFGRRDEPSSAKVDRAPDIIDPSRRHEYAGVEGVLSEGEVPYSTTLEFYNSRGWKRCRYGFLREWRSLCDPVCMCCRVSEQTKLLNVDRILPLKNNWFLRYDWNNLQVLCEDCNIGKGSTDTTDFRPAHFKTHIAEVVRRKGYGWP